MDGKYRISQISAREITFLHTINDNSVTLQNGVLVIDLEKQIGDLEFPVAGEKDGNKIEEVVEEKV